jgi:hypothetical protein
MKKKVEKRPVPIGPYIFLILVCIIGFWSSLSCLIKLSEIFYQPEHLAVSTYDINYASSTKSSSETIRFDFYVNDKYYKISDNWWWTNADINKDEKFDITFYKPDPQLCIPSNAVSATLFWNALVFCIFLVLFIAVWLFRPWKYEVEKKI